MRRGKRHWVIDFLYIDKSGTEQRYRRDAKLQTSAGARAEAARRRQLAIETGSVDGKPAAMLFRDFVAETFEPVYVPGHCRPGTIVRYRALLHREGILGYFGSMRLDLVGATHFHEYAAIVKGRRVQHRPHWSLVRTVLRAAVSFGKLERMPELPKLPKPSKKLPDGPSREEWQAAIGHAAGWMKVAIALGVLAGLRSGEIRALQVGDVDLAHMQINVRRAFSAADVLTPKDDEERVVPIIPELEAILRPAVESRATDARVIVTSMGSTPGRQAMLTALNRVQDKHGLRRRSVHALRHGFCSELVRRGASLEAVRLLAGHADLKTTQRYVHATAGDLVEAMSKLRGNGEVTAKEKSR